jgi:hypothetical protein
VEEVDIRRRGREKKSVKRKRKLSSLYGKRSLD